VRLPDISYARNGDIDLAYQAFGDGPHGLVFVPGFVSHLEGSWDLPGFDATMERLSRFARIVRFDKRGTGLSDRAAEVGTLEERMDDVRAVMDAAGMERATLVGNSEGGPMVLLFAAMHADRTERIMLSGSWARLVRDDDYPIGLDAELVGQFASWVSENWGTGKALGAFFTGGNHVPAREMLARNERQAASPGALRRIWTSIIDTDVRGVLDSIHVPTLIVHSEDDQQVPLRLGRYIADHVDDAQFVEIGGSHGDSLFSDEVTIHLERFVTGDAPAMHVDRVLATVLFTDIVGSTERAVDLGDTRWRAVLDDHDERVRREVARHNGREVKHTGDGFLAAFDGPARAVQCGLAITDAVRPLGIEVRAGVHTGECERRGDDLGGIAVHTGARVAALAVPSEVLVTRTVKDLVAGSGLVFTDRGEHELKGVPDSWRLYSASSA
jgi:class 3 adenylate cyclase